MFLKKRKFLKFSFFVIIYVIRIGDIMDFKEEISLLDKKLSDLWRSL